MGDGSSGTFSKTCLLWTILKGNRKHPHQESNTRIHHCVGPSRETWKEDPECSKFPHKGARAQTGAGSSFIPSHEIHLISAVLSHPRSNAWTYKHSSLQITRKSWLNRSIEKGKQKPWLHPNPQSHHSDHTHRSGMCLLVTLYKLERTPPVVPLGRQGQTYYFSHKGLIIHSSNVDASSQCVEFFTSKFLSYKNAFRWKMLLTRKACGGYLNLVLGAFPFPSQRLHAQHWYWY